MTASPPFERFCLALAFVTVVSLPSSGQPQRSNGNVLFTLQDSGYASVSLVGDFNGWTKGEDIMRRDTGGIWTISKSLAPGMFQYTFVVDGDRYVPDPANPARVENYNRSGENSVFVLTDGGEVILSSSPVTRRRNPDDRYARRVPSSKPIYLNIIWHQHQPLYVNPVTDHLAGPWVRTHATKDYYDMAAMLERYPDIHCTINLTSSLLHQLREYYVSRLRPFIDVKKGRIDVAGFLARWKGKTDPWIDLALKPTKNFNQKDKDHLYNNAWNAFGVSEVMLERFPEYKALRDKMASLDQMPGLDVFTEQEMREIKFWFYLAYFDPDFFLGPVKLPDGSVCDLSDYLEQREGKFRLRKQITEADCRRMVVETFKVMANIIPAHKRLMYHPGQRKGQVEVITTPYYHPILPLIYDSDLARICQPNDPLPPRFSFPADAHAQVAKAVRMYREVFGRDPTGMWPAEGSVGQPVLGTFRRNGILWTASDVKVLRRSRPANQPNTTAYRFPADTVKGNSRSIALVFRDTELSDRIGFTYQNYPGEEAAEDFVRSILSFEPDEHQSDVLITVILDGENAWEWYRHDMDGKEFLNALYRKLSRLYQSRQIITTTMTEYIEGNPERGVMAHPIDKLPAMSELWPGSWINANYDTWIGEPEENRAWEYLLRARSDLEKTGIRRPDPTAAPPRGGTKDWYGYMAWEAMYAAEGSDWFWWYGADQTAPGGERPFDDAFRRHLENVYVFARQAGSTIRSPGFSPITSGNASDTDGQGAMGRSRPEMQQVIFTCDASSESVADAIYIAGSTEELGAWVPNVVRLYDDGTNGDDTAGDGVWSVLTEVPVGKEVYYKYTNSGARGVWVPGEEFPARNRTLSVQQRTEGVMRTNDTFGQ